MKLLISVALAFAFGVFSSDFFIANYRMFFGGEQNLQCLPDNGPCVGDKLSETYVGGMYIFDRIGGLDAIFCEDLNPNIMDEEYLSVNDILKGQRCEGNVEGFSFRNSTASTVVIVKQGVISEIRRGSLHAIDL